MIYESRAVTKLIIQSSLFVTVSVTFCPKFAYWSHFLFLASRASCILPVKVLFSLFFHSSAHSSRAASFTSFLFFSPVQSHENATQCTLQLSRPLIHSIDALTWLQYEWQRVCLLNFSLTLAFVMTLITHFLFLSFFLLSLWLYLLRLNFYHFSSSIIIYIYTRHT